MQEGVISFNVLKHIMSSIHVLVLTVRYTLPMKNYSAANVLSRDLSSQVNIPHRQYMCQVKQVLTDQRIGRVMLPQAQRADTVLQWNQRIPQIKYLQGER